MSVEKESGAVSKVEGVIRTISRRPIKSIETDYSCCSID